MDSALGLLETRGLLASVVGADAALKAAQVTLKGVEQVGGGLTAVVLTGEVAAMEAALSAAYAASLALTSYCRIHLIPRLDSQVRPVLSLDGAPTGFPAPRPPAGDGAPQDPAYREKPRTASPGEVVELGGPEEVLALAATPEEAQELLPTVLDWPDSPGGLGESSGPGPAADGGDGDGDAEDGEPKPAAKKNAKAAARKNRKR